MNSLTILQVGTSRIMEAGERCCTGHGHAACQCLRRGASHAPLAPGGEEVVWWKWCGWCVQWVVGQWEVGRGRAGVGSMGRVVGMNVQGGKRRSSSRVSSAR